MNPMISTAVILCAVIVVFLINRMPLPVNLMVSDLAVDAGRGRSASSSSRSSASRCSPV